MKNVQNAFNLAEYDIILDKLNELEKLENRKLMKHFGIN